MNERRHTEMKPILPEDYAIDVEEENNDKEK